jgi:hypothetical protein
LSTTDTWHKKTRERDSYQFKKYCTPACKTCPVQTLCTLKADGRREIELSQYADAVEKNGLNYLANKDLYRKRQEINELVPSTSSAGKTKNPTIESEPCVGYSFGNPPVAFP